MIDGEKRLAPEAGYMDMRMRILGIGTILAAALLVSLPANAHYRHWGGYARPYVSFGYSYGYPYRYRPFGYYSSFYAPFYGPSVGFHVSSRLPHRRVSTVRDRGEQQAFKLYVYPAAGQTEEQTAGDRYDCHVWAADQSGFDPTLGAGERDEAENYTRAFTACMEGRDYVVK
ncbi:MAG TPA: hypothetical protein VGC50_16740 [Gammaproteobacteria bacterium]|jgi:hypothetical protein